MIRDIIHDETFLSQKAEPAKKTAEDLETANDLLETLEFHQKECVGLAANMIGKNKAIIAVNIHGSFELMFNPVIISKSDLYETEEGCLSLEGTRKCQRYKHIEVAFENYRFQKKTRKFSGFTAEIVQHEIDHLMGILI